MELKQQAAKATENWDRLLRTTADFDNYKKRMAREKQEAVKYANENLQEAFEHNVRLVRLGSGAYDVKRRLGFPLEDTNHAMISMPGFTARAKKQVVATE